MQTQSHSWGSKSPIPASLFDIPKTGRRYEVKSVNRVIVIGVAKARQARRSWAGRTRRLPAENVAAIKLLDSWLSTPDVERDEFQERIDRLVEENRL